MTFYAGIFIEGPAAGQYHSGPADKHTVDGCKYSHRVLVKFTGNAQTIDAWVPRGMTNAVALQRVFDAYQALHATEAGEAS